MNNALSKKEHYLNEVHKNIPDDVGFTSVFFCWLLVDSLLSLLSTEVSREDTWLPVGEELAE